MYNTCNNNNNVYVHIIIIVMKQDEKKSGTESEDKTTKEEVKKEEAILTHLKALLCVAPSQLANFQKYLQIRDKCVKCKKNNRWINFFPLKKKKEKKNQKQQKKEQLTFVDIRGHERPEEAKHIRKLQNLTILQKNKYL